MNKKRMKELAPAIAVTILLMIIAIVGAMNGDRISGAIVIMGITIIIFGLLVKLVQWVIDVLWRIFS